MNSARMLGVALLAIGVILAIIGLQATDSLGERLSNTFTGRWTDKTNFYIVGGIAAAIVGALLAFAGGRNTLKA